MEIKQILLKALYNNDPIIADIILSYITKHCRICNKNKLHQFSSHCNVSKDTNFYMHLCDDCVIKYALHREHRCVNYYNRDGRCNIYKCGMYLCAKCSTVRSKPYFPPVYMDY